jgi:hypothetical protein
LPSASAWRAGTAYTLDGSGSYSLIDNPRLTYSWQQLGGPSTLIWSSQVDSKVTVTGAVAGTYNFALTVRDSSGQRSTAPLTIGAVATQSNGVVVTGNAAVGVTNNAAVVVTGNAAMDQVLGPLTIMGTSPWPYFDIASAATATSIATAALANTPQLGSAIAGTVTLSGNPVTMVGSGTNFLSSLTNGRGVCISWDNTDGANMGRYCDAVTKVIDNTHATLAAYYTNIAIPSAGSVYPILPDTSTNQFCWWAGQCFSAGNNNWNYYDLVIALYRLYYRTGQVQYLTQARQMADLWYTWGINSGAGYANIPYPRVAALLGQFARAVDGHPERFPALYQMVGSMYTAFQADHPETPNNFDARESGYTHWFMALGAKLDPDPGRHAQYCTWLNNITPSWISAQQYWGGWAEYTYYGNAFYMNAPPYGTSPWRTDIPIHGLEAAYEVLNDTSSAGCNNPTLAASLLTTIKNAVNFTYNYGRASQNRGVFYDVVYPVLGLSTTYPTGTVSVNSGSTSVVGSGTSFLTAFTCNGKDYIGFNTPRTGYLVTACADNTHLTIDTAYGTQGESGNLTGSTIDEAPQAYSGSQCGTSLSPYCEWGGPGMTAPDRNLTRLMPGMTAWLYNQTGDPQYLAWADEWFSAAFGGPASGPNSATNIGSYSPSCGGPGCDGYIGDYVASLPDCASNAPPCVPGGSVFGNLAKNFAQGSGVSGAENALAWRLGPPQRPH